MPAKPRQKNPKRPLKYDSEDEERALIKVEQISKLNLKGIGQSIESAKPQILFTGFDSLVMAVSKSEISHFLLGPTKTCT